MLDPNKIDEEVSRHARLKSMREPLMTFIGFLFTGVVLLALSMTSPFLVFLGFLGIGLFPFAFLYLAYEIADSIVHKSAYQTLKSIRASLGSTQK